MTPITALLAEGFTLSVEMWPPRTVAAGERLAESLHRLQVLEPSFASITYGAAGSTRERTHELVVELHEEGAIVPMAHLVCAAHRRSELVEILSRYREAGIENILALRGDPPLEATAELPQGELHHAIELVDLAKEVGRFCVAVAAHPEGHPDATSLVEDRRHLATKLAHADFGVTQFFFRIEDYLRLVDDLDHLGNVRPIIPGIMPITNVRTVTRMAELSGTAIPTEIVDRVNEVADEPEAVRRVGVEIATELCARLLEEGVPGIHFYTMNQVSATLEICERLDLLPGGARRGG